MILCPGRGMSGLEEEFEVDVDQVERGPFSIVDVGFRCPRCGRVFGHEVVQ